MWTIFPLKSLTWIRTDFCTQFFRINPYWVCGHLKLIKIWHKSLLICGHLKLVKIWHEFLLNLWTIFLHESLLNLWASKAIQNSTWTLTEFCTQFFCINPYWICGHLKSKPSQNSAEFLNEMCRQFCRMNPYWIRGHLKLVKVQQNSLVKFVDNFPAWILTEFMSI